MLQRKAPDSGADKPAGPGGEVAEAEAALLSRLQAMEERMARAEGGRSEVEVAHAQVRRMLGRIGAVEPHVVLNTLEGLVEAAQKCQHKEAEFYKRAFAEAKRHESAEGFNSLVIQFFGTSEDRRVAAALTNWHKVVRAEGGSGKGQKKESPPPPALQQAPHYPPPMAPPVYPHMYGYPFPPQHAYGQGGFSPRRGRGGFGARRAGRGDQAEGGGRCFACNEPGHKAAECRSLKDFRANKYAK